MKNELVLQVPAAGAYILIFNVLTRDWEPVLDQVRRKNGTGLHTC